MNANETYLEAARAYADGVRVLFAPSGEPTGDRGGRGPTSYSDLTTQAKQLSALSAQFTKAASGRLADPAPEVRAKTATALLAKALTDLEISGYLLEAAQDQEVESVWGSAKGADRRSGSTRATEPYLKLLLGEEREQPGRERTAAAPRDLPAARVELIQGSGDALALISVRANSTGKTALEGLVGLGAGELAKAAGVVGMDIAQALGQAEKVAQLYDLFRGFLFKAYDSIVALLGPQLVKIVGEHVTNWVEKIKEGEPIGALLEKLYETEQTKAALRQEIEESQAELARFVAAIEQVSGLNEAFRQQTSLVDKILPKLKWVTLIPAAALPQGRLLLAAAYIALSGYVVLVGADYVDAPRLERLERVPGVRRVVEANLAVVKQYLA